MRVASLLLKLAALALLAPALAAAEPRRVLHVSLYPYIPEPAAAALTLKQGFERLHPEVIVDITLNPNYYSLKPQDGGVLYENADVHEIDVVFMRDFLARHKLQPPGATLAPAIASLTALTRVAATYGGTVMAVPQWQCADFLIYRADKTGLDGPGSLAALRASLGPDHGLLLNLTGSGQLGELYLSSLLADGGATPQAVLAHMSATPDPAVLARLQLLLSLEPAGFGRNARYGTVESFYARQFARRAGSAFVGYSELTHDVLEETANGCRDEEHCVTQDQLRVAAFPFADGKIRPAVWVDMFGIDAHVHGRALADAQDFIRYAVSLPAYRALLIPEPGGIPRYLLPASTAAFEDLSITAAAPLYARFRGIVERGVVVTVPHLSDTLRTVAARIDADLPRVH